MVQKKIATRKTSNRCISFFLFLYYLLQSIVLFFIPISFKKRKDIKNQTVLITGGGSGLGQLMTLEFLKLGCKVVMWDVNDKGIEMTKKMSKDEKLNTNDLYTYKVDLSDSKAIYDTSKQVKEEVGPVDILINNAGIVSGQNFLDIPDEKIILTFKVNTLSHFFTIKAFLPDMIKQKRGHIVTVASVAGSVGVCSLSDYCASKFANVGMDYSLRMELAKANIENNIKTTIVKPYFISTGMFAGADPGVFSYLKPEYVVHKIIEAVLTESVQVVLPSYLDWIIPLISILPIKCVSPIYDFVGGYELMNNFHGRMQIKEAEINNNLINKNNRNTK